MRFVGDADRNAHIEDTIVAASSEGMDSEDLRVLSVLTTWLDVHSERVNVDRVYRALTDQSPRVRAYWAAIARWMRTDARWARVARVHRGARVELVQGAEFLIRRNGEDPRFADGPLRAATGMLRDRRSDVSTPANLARRHRGYHWRVLMGPSYRADMWARLEADPTLSAAALARSCHGSYATGWQVRRDFALVR